MEHYLGEKLKNLRESRNWSQAELAKRLNKAVSTISGYESDAHAIPLDVLVSISLLFGVSTDELLDLETTNVLSLSGLTEEQCNLLRKIRQEYLSPSQRGKDFSKNQMGILHDIISSFGQLIFVNPHFSCNRLLKLLMQEKCFFGGGGLNDLKSPTAPMHNFMP